MNIYITHKFPIVYSHKFVSFKRLPLQPYDCFDGIDSDDSGTTDPISNDYDSELTDIFFNKSDTLSNNQKISLDDSVLPFFQYTNIWNEFNIKSTAAFNQNGQLFQTISNDGIARKFNQTDSQSLLCGYMALAGGLYQMDDIIFSDIYKIIGLDESKVVNCNLYIHQKSYSAVQAFQKYFGYELYEFSQSDTFYDFLLQHIQEFQFSDQEIVDLLTKNSNVDRQRLELLLSFISNGKVSLYINDEHSDVLIPHIRLINRDGSHWECVNFKHLT